MPKIKKRYLFIISIAIALFAILFRSKLVHPATSIIQLFRGKKTVIERTTEFEQIVQQRLAPDFKKIGVPYPPKKLTLVGLKDERLLEVWVSNPPKLLKTYPILGASGILGPKLKEGDRQVPEGLYCVESLNPNSLFHLALRLNYPNRFDKKKGALDGRKNLGSDIMIHGKSCSIGCLAMGDLAAEDLFVLVAKAGVKNCTIILSPVDFRKRDLPKQMPKVPDWTPELYALIKEKLQQLHP
jgi:hypothetical protein